MNYGVAEGNGGNGIRLLNEGDIVVREIIVFSFRGRLIADVGVVVGIVENYEAELICAADTFRVTTASKSPSAV